LKKRREKLVLLIIHCVVLAGSMLYRTERLRLDWPHEQGMQYLVYLHRQSVPEVQLGLNSFFLMSSKKPEFGQSKTI
jgi:hypothetical protein